MNGARTCKHDDEKVGPLLLEIDGRQKVFCGNRAVARPLHLMEVVSVE